MDELVLRAQRFINSYSVEGIPAVEENGKTSWEVMYALTRALQYELGLTTLSDNFGPATLARLQSQYPVIDAGTHYANLLRIVQSGLYCKGYDGGEIDGLYNDRVAASVDELKTNMGVDVAFPRGLTPKVFKALLNMDPYVVVAGGREDIRSVQQWLNGRYVGRANFFILPCDGHFSRDVQKGLMLAIQFQLGFSDDVATGVFGPATKEGLRNNPLTVGSTGTWVNLFSAAMLFNRRPGVVFTGTFDSLLSGQVRVFQDFVKLPVTGNGDFPTWASLLVSTGDNTRRGTACDTVTQVTAARAQALRAAGYQYVGRYLSNVPGSTLNKMIQPGELDTIVAGGLRVFPIYQTFGGSAEYFNYAQGTVDALAAIERARYYGFKAGTTIYFAVDFDALDYQVTDNVIPHFRGIADALRAHSAGYGPSIYGPRNVCSRVGDLGLVVNSFASDMSTGFSGNLGYPMPENWAFDQISTVSVGSGTGLIEIDNNIVSGRDSGQGSFAPAPIASNLDVDFDMAQRAQLLSEVQNYLVSIGVPEDSFPLPEPTVRTTTSAFGLLMQYDAIVTALARQLRMRKSLIQCPLFWEMRKFNVLDPIADDNVIAYYRDGNPLGSPDSSTGLAQIFAATAINSHNHCVTQNIIGGRILDTSSDGDMWEVWQQLHSDDGYNISTVPLVLIWNASLLGQGRPGLDYGEEDTRRVMGRYNSTDPDGEYGYQLIGLYRVFEKYNAPLRG